MTPSVAFLSAVYTGAALAVALFVRALVRSWKTSTVKIEPAGEPLKADPSICYLIVYDEALLDVPTVNGIHAALLEMGIQHLLVGAAYTDRALKVLRVDRGSIVKAVAADAGYVSVENPS